MMHLRDNDLTFRPRRNNGNRLVFWAVLIFGALWMLFQVRTGEIEPLFLPTPTPTRTGISLAQEGLALFESGDLDGAIQAYSQALERDPNNAEILTELAQIQTYSSGLLTTDQERAERLQEAQRSISRALEINPDSSRANAVHAFVLDWSASSLLATSRDVREKMLGDAANAAERALILNPQNALALVYLAEVQLDQQSWVQSQQTIEAALELDATLMDAHRVHGIVLESLGQYRAAIEAYERAAAIAPNLTFLYIYIGLNYRNLQVYDRALEFFDRAAQINTQNGVEDPLPYIAISKTYSQQGEFFIASRNAERAVSIDPYNANTYGQLGIIYVKARNYEGALPVLACVVYGCSAADNEVAGVDVTGLPLSNIEVAYYYLQYGSVLAALNQCPAAAPVLDMVENAYGSDPVIASIIAENEEICRRLEAADSQGG